MSAAGQEQQHESGNRPVVVLDANVLYPAQLRDLLIRLAVAGFIRALYEAEPGRLVDVARQHRATLRKPPLIVAQYLTTLGRAGLEQTVTALRAHEDAL